MSAKTKWAIVQSVQALVLCGAGAWLVYRSLYGG